MATGPAEIRPEVLDRVRRLAEECHCSMDEVLQRAPDQIEPPRPSAKSVIGLFADEPLLADQILDDVYCTRENGKLRLPDHG
jgi:hypothetical protein